MRLRLPGRREIVCQQAVELATDYLESTLTPAARRRFERHLAGCEHCSEYLAQMRATIAVAGRITPEDLTSEMRTAFAELYENWRREEHGD
jgi:anti-sigma factor RsiW